MVGIDAVMAPGSANRHDEPANICCSADYVEVGTPGGQRRTEDPRDSIWGCGGDRNYIPFEGGRRGRLQWRPDPAGGPSREF